jgi:O-antigen/teichoic acid export membrane protein
VSQLKKLLGDSLTYGLGSLLLRATQILVLPLILYYLKKDEFGTLDYFLNIKNILVTIYGWGILTSIFKFTELKNKKDNSPFVGFLVALTIISVSSIIVIILAVLVPQVKAYSNEIFLTHLIAVFASLMTIPLGIFRQKRMPVTYIMINVVYTLVFLSSSYLFMIFTNLNYKSLLWGHAFAAIITFVFGIMKAYKFIEIKFSSSLYKKMFNFGFSILLNSLSFVIILATTRFFLKYNGTFEDIGILGMAMRLSLFVGALLIAPFTLAWLPFVKTQIDKKDFFKTMNNAFRIFSWVGLFFCLTFELLIHDLFHLIKNTEYLSALDYVLPFTLAYFVQGLYFIFSAGIFISGNTKQYRIIGIVGPTLNIILYFLFINHLNIQIVGIITLISFIVTTVLSYIFGNKNLKINVLRSENVIIYIIYFVLLMIVVNLPVFRIFSSLAFIIKILSIFTIFGVHLLWEKKLSFIPN